jgi:hypothetical protein
VAADQREPYLPSSASIFAVLLEKGSTNYVISYYFACLDLRGGFTTDKCKGRLKTRTGFRALGFWVRIVICLNILE